MNKVLYILILLSPSPDVCSISLTTCHARWPGGLARASHWSECHLALSLAAATCPRYVLQKSQDSFLIEDQIWSPIGLQTLSCPLDDLCSRLSQVLASCWLLSPFPGLPLAGCITVTSVWQNAAHMSPLPPLLGRAWRGDYIRLCIRINNSQCELEMIFSVQTFEECNAFLHTPLVWKNSEVAWLSLTATYRRAKSIESKKFQLNMNCSNLRKSCIHLLHKPSWR